MRKSGPMERLDLYSRPGHAHLGFVEFLQDRNACVTICYVQTHVRRAGWMQMMLKYTIALVMKRAAIGLTVEFRLDDHTDYLSAAMRAHSGSANTYTMPNAFALPSLYHKLGFRFVARDDVEMRLVLRRTQRSISFLTAGARRTFAPRPYFCGATLMLRGGYRRMPRFAVVYMGRNGHAQEISGVAHMRLRSLATRPVVQAAAE